MTYKEYKRELLVCCREAFATKGCKFIEVTHLDGRRSGVANPDAIRVVMDALIAELDRQIAALPPAAAPAAPFPVRFAAFRR